MPVVTVAVWMGLAVPVAVPELSTVPERPAHSETMEVRSPVPEGVPIKSILTRLSGLLPTVPYTITVFSCACDQT